MRRELILTELVRGTKVAWEWSGPVAELARAKGVRPVGRVITHEDLPTMTARIEVGIQTDDDPAWVLNPVEMLAKGRKILAAD